MNFNQKTYVFFLKYICFFLFLFRKGFFYTYKCRGKLSVQYVLKRCFLQRN